MTAVGYAAGTVCMVTWSPGLPGLIGERVTIVDPGLVPWTEIRRGVMRDMVRGLVLQRIQDSRGGRGCWPVAWMLPIEKNPESDDQVATHQPEEATACT